MTRAALVTGAARGIGAATCRRLASEGYDVLALDWSAGPAASPYPMPTPDELAALPEATAEGRIATRVADVRSQAAMDSAVAEVLERWGRLDVVVCAAAVITGGKPQWETPPQQLALLWDIDARGVWTVAAAAVPAMLAGPDPAGCRFVAIASAAGSQGLFRLTGYTMVKHAVVGLVKGLAADLVGTGVTAVAVSPGSTDTAMLQQTAALYPDADVDDLVSHQLLKRPLTPEEIAATVAFCCSREGAALNGSVVHADGGFGA
jgi:SDR family mycofactocin-dependent oxidoreductase